MPDGLDRLPSDITVDPTSYGGKTESVDLELIEGTNTYRSDPINPTEELDLDNGEIFTAEFGGDTASTRSFPSADDAQWARRPSR